MTKYKIMCKSQKYGIVKVKEKQINTEPFFSKDIAEVYCKGLNDGSHLFRKATEYVVVAVEI